MTSKARASSVLADSDGHPCFGARARQRGQPGQVDGHLDFRGWSGPAATSTEAGTPASTAAERSSARQAARLEHRRIDALRKPHRLVEPPLDVATHLFEDSPGRRGIGVHRLSEELEIDRERDEQLMYAIVKVALDAAAVGIRGDDEPFPRCAQRLDLDPQSIELA